MGSFSECKLGSVQHTNHHAGRRNRDATEWLFLPSLRCALTPHACCTVPATAYRPAGSLWEHLVAPKAIKTSNARRTFRLSERISNTESPNAALPPSSRCNQAGVFLGSVLLQELFQTSTIALTHPSFSSKRSGKRKTPLRRGSGCIWVLSSSLLGLLGLFHANGTSQGTIPRHDALIFLSSCRAS